MTRRVLLAGMVAGVLVAGVVSASDLGPITRPTLSSFTVTVNRCSLDGVQRIHEGWTRDGRFHLGVTAGDVTAIVATGLPADCEGMYLAGVFLDKDGQQLGHRFTSASATNCGDPPTLDALSNTISGGAVTVNICHDSSDHMRRGDVKAMLLIAQDASG